MSKVTIYVGISDRGHRLGQDHHNATISDAAVDIMRELHEDHGLSFDAIVKELGHKYKKSAVQKICTYERRAQFPQKYKRVTIYE